MTTVDRILRLLAESAILGGTEVVDDGLRLWIGDKARGIRAQTVIGRPNRFVSEMSLFQVAEAWFTQAALELYPDSPFGRDRGGRAKKHRREKPPSHSRRVPSAVSSPLNARRPRSGNRPPGL